MSFDTIKMCLTNLRLLDNKPLSQKLIVEMARFGESSVEQKHTILLNKGFDGLVI